MKKKKSLIGLILKAVACFSLALAFVSSAMIANCQSGSTSGLGEDTGVTYYSLP